MAESGNYDFNDDDFAKMMGKLDDDEKEVDTT